MLVGIYTRGNKCSALFLLNIKITEISKKFLFLNFCKCGHSYEKSNDFDKDNNDDDGDGNGSDVDVDKTIKCC